VEAINTAEVMKTPERLEKITNYIIGNLLQNLSEAEPDEQTLAGLSEDEGLNAYGLEKIVTDYIFTDLTPLSDHVIRIMNKRPGLKERSGVAKHVVGKIKNYVATFVRGVD
jgi:type I restriction enzyme R subunit